MAENIPMKILGIPTALVFVAAALWYIKIYRPKHESN